VNLGNVLLFTFLSSDPIRPPRHSQGRTPPPRGTYILELLSLAHPRAVLIGMIRYINTAGLRIYV